MFTASFCINPLHNGFSPVTGAKRPSKTLETADSEKQLFVGRYSFLFQRWKEIRGETLRAHAVDITLFIIYAAELNIASVQFFFAGKTKVKISAHFHHQTVFLFIYSTVSILLLNLCSIVCILWLRFNKNFYFSYTNKIKTLNSETTETETNKERDF